MIGADLKCPKCGGRAINVSPDYPLEPASDLLCGVPQQWTEGRCGNGHVFCLRSINVGDYYAPEWRHEYLPDVFDVSGGR